MKRCGLIVTFFLALGSFANAACITHEEARRALQVELAKSSELDYFDFDAQGLIEDLKIFEAHYHAQVDYSYRGEEGGYYTGRIFGNVYCDGRAEIVISADHD